MEKKAVFHLMPVGPKIERVRAGRSERLDPLGQEEEAAMTEKELDAKFVEFFRALEDEADRTGEFPWGKITLLVMGLVAKEDLTIGLLKWDSPSYERLSRTAYEKLLRKRLSNGRLAVDDVHHIIEMKFETTSEQRREYGEKLAKIVLSAVRRSRPAAERPVRRRDIAFYLNWALDRP
jgi:hypothetical protein